MSLALMVSMCLVMQIEFVVEAVTVAENVELVLTSTVFVCLPYWAGIIRMGRAVRAHARVCSRFLSVQAQILQRIFFQVIVTVDERILIEWSGIWRDDLKNWIIKVLQLKNYLLLLLINIAKW